MNETEILTVRFEGRAPYPPLAVLGMQGEHNAQRIRFRNLPEFDGGTALLNAVLPDGAHGDAIALENGLAVISRDLTAQPGSVTAWVTVSVGEDIVWKSEKMLLKIGGLPGISGIIERQYPSALESAVAQTAQSAEDAEAWAVGTRGGEDAESTDPAYHSNAKYYAIQAGERQAEASASAASAEAQAQTAEAYAVGTRDSTAVASDDPTYHNNAKYYSEQAGSEVAAKAVRYDAAQSLTDSQQSQARDNINAAATDGYYENLTSGQAEQLISSVFVTDKVPYNFRTSGGSADIGNREVDKLVGGTIAWNQLVGSGTETVTVASGHKLLTYIGGTWTIQASDGTAISVTGGTDMVFDLTQMFGSAIADYIDTLETGTPGAGVSWFRSRFPKPYYAFNAGELMSVQAASHNTTGFNQWDEETELGYLDLDNGTEKASNSIIRMKNYVPILPSTVYYLKCGSAATNVFRVCWYDAGKNFISNTSAANKTNNTVTTPANAYFMRAYFANYGTTYKNDICINLHWDGERDGEYEPYVKHAYPLDSSLTLRGIPKLDANSKLYYDGDTYESDGTVTRKWAELTNQSGAVGDTITLTGIDTSATDIITSIGHLADVGTLSGDTLTLTAALSGASIVYPLATPTTESADPYQNPQIVDDWGTEEYVDAGVTAVTPTRDVAIPVGHETQYQNNLRAKVEMAPESPSGNGDYIVRQTGGQNAYVLLEKELPALPTTDGTYDLVCTVTSGVATLTWEART